jgi:ribonuclease E
MEAAFYILNQKRIHLRELENRFGVAIAVMADETLVGLTNYVVERGEPALRIEHKAAATGIQIDAIAPMDEPEDEDLPIDEEEEISAAEPRSEEDNGEETEANGRRRRRRRRRRGRERDGMPEGVEASENGASGAQDDDEGSESEDEAAPADAEAVSEAGSESGEGHESGEERNGRRRRRGRRGGRGRTRDENGEFAPETPVEGDEAAVQAVSEAPAEPKQAEREPVLASESNIAISREQPAVEAPQAEAHQAEPPQPVAPPEPEPEPVAVVLTPPDPDRPKRAGWWSRAKSVLSGE